MSRGLLDQEALDAISRASADATKRGLAVVGVTSRHYGERRAFTFDLVPVKRARGPASPSGKATGFGPVTGGSSPPAGTARPSIAHDPDAVEAEVREIRIRRGGVPPIKASQGTLDI